MARGVSIPGSGRGAIGGERDRDAERQRDRETQRQREQKRERQRERERKTERERDGPEFKGPPDAIAKRSDQKA